MSDHDDLGEGHSIAAWTSVIVMLVAFAGGTIAFWFAVPWLVWSFAGLVVVGAILWPLLSKLGYGTKIHS